MDVVSFDGVDREVVFSDDETQVLYTRWTISVNALLNPKTLYGAGKSPIKADLATRQKLWTPRKKLFLLSPSAETIAQVEPGWDKSATTSTTIPPVASADSALEAAARATAGSQIQSPYQVLLESPPSFVSQRSTSSTNPISVEHASDAKDGPTPLKLDITQIHGTGTFLIRYVIRTYVSPEMDSPNAIPSPVAAHRWEMSFSATEDYYTIRTIDGKVTFRKDALFALDEGPDDWRAFLAHPIPVGYRRSPPVVNLSSDGTELTYQIQDVEQANNFNPWDTGATYIDIGESVAFSRGEGLLGVNLNIAKVAETADTAGSVAGWTFLPGWMIGKKISKSIWGN